jgi:hypothetical protein
MFISTSSPRRSISNAFGLTLESDLLHRGKVSWFCHIEAQAVGFVVRGLIVPHDNAWPAAATDEITIRRL